ncbi:THAP domain-containing protein [Plakobranchus ocellatus]|uniref:THAP domain-containing protein n=1 Tax=Plakobranchus ocellatus TaxID=259542 RepID=A0AAV3YGL3_9GAST|nr:THAP domain-containing protein [Plakobranchus ocellatus]
MKVVCVMFDAVSIKKECVYDGKTGSFTGGVNFVKYMDSKSEMATEALPFIVVRVKGRWKLPFGYFLGKAGGEIQGQLVKDAVCLLSEKGFNVIAVTCYGSYANQKTATLPGCSLDVNSLKSSFPNPDDPCKEVFFSFDACHLLKNPILGISKANDPPGLLIFKAIRRCYARMRSLTLNWVTVTFTHQILSGQAVMTLLRRF